MSPALAMSFSSISIFAIALICYIKYKEQVNLKLFVGMVLIVGAVVLVSLSRATKNSSDVTFSLAPVMLGLGQGLIYAFNALCVKYLGRKGYSSIRITIDYLFIYSFFPMILFFYE